MTRVIASSPAYLEQMDRILLEAGEGVVMDYLQWQGLRSALPHLAKPFADEAFSFQSAVFGVAVQPPRECRLRRHLWLSRQSRCICTVK